MKKLLCLNCGFEFEENYCPLCSWSSTENGDAGNKDVRITLVFEENKESPMDEILELAKSACFFTRLKTDFGVQYYATYLPNQAADFFQLYEKVEKGYRLQILVNGKTRPYTRTLWIPLLWFLMDK